MQKSTLYVTPSGQLIRQTETEWPQVFVTGVLPDCSDKALILMLIEGWRLHAIHIEELPTCFNVGVKLISHHLGFTGMVGPTKARELAQIRGYLL